MTRSTAWLAWAGAIVMTLGLIILALKGEKELVTVSADTKIAIEDGAEDWVESRAIEDMSSQSIPDFLSEVDKKRARRDVNAEVATGRSISELELRMQTVNAAFFGGDSTNRHLAELHQQLTEQFGVEEADFRLALIANSSDWEALKNIVNQRSTALGTIDAYDQMLLEMGIATGKISFEEIEDLSSNGNRLPHDLIYSLASQGQIDTIKKLAEKNLLANLNYEQPILSRNAIGALIDHASNFPGTYESRGIKDAIDVLIGVGVVPMPVNGAPGPLDDVLTNISNRNFQIKYSMAEKLLEHGVPLEPSHRELISSLPTGSNKEQLEKLFANFL